MPEEPEVKWIVSVLEETICNYENIIMMTNNQTFEVPTIKAASSEHFSVLVIDSLLAVVSQQDVWCTNFKKTIEDVAILEGGYIAVADQTGTVSLGILTDKFEVKQSCNFIAEKSVCQENVYLKIEFQITEETDGRTKARLICLCASGRIFIFNDIILIDKDLDLSMVKMERLESIHLQAYDFASNEHSIITVGSGIDCLAVYSSDGSKFDICQTATLEDDTELVKIQTSASTNIYLTLESKGQLYIWDALTLCIIYTWSLPDVLDFRIIELETEENFRLENLKLITKERNNKICAYNMLTQSVIKEIWLRDNLAYFSKWPSSNDDIYLATYCLDEICEKQAMVYLRNYAETSPEKRLKYLVSKRRFDEAEKWAKQHGLDFVLDPLYVKQRLMESKETFEETRQHIAKCKAQLLENQSRDAATMNVLSLINTMEHRLEAYVRVNGENQFCPQVWETFRDEAPLQLFDQLLMDETEKAFIFWECFQDELIQELKPGMIKLILDNIPGHIPYSLTGDWLCQMVIPFIITKDPSSVAAIIQWVEIQVISLETTNKKTWPVDAINFCQFVLEKLERAVHCDIDQFDLTKLSSVKCKFSCASAMSPLRDLIKLLDWLNDLRTKYNYQITLQALIKETKESVVFRMLDRVMMVDLLPVVLQDQVLPYIQNNDLVADQLFANYIQDLLERSAGGTMHYIVTEKIKSFIRLISSPKEKITAMLKLLKSVKFPLPEFVKELTEEILSNCQHFLVSELAETWKQIESNNAIFLYGIHPTAVKNISDVKQVARYIIAKGGPFSHVEKILLANNITEAGKIEVHCFQCQLLVDRNELDSLSKHIRSLPPEISRKCCQHIIAIAVSFMTTNDHLNVEIPRSFRMQYYEAADIVSNILITMTDSVIEKSEFVGCAQSIKNVQKLEVQYNLLINLENLRDKTKCLTILKEQMQNINPQHIFRFARLLNIKEAQVLKELLCKAAVPDHLQSVKSVLCEVSSNVPENESLSAEFRQNFLRLIDRADISWPKVCLQICQLCLSHFSQNSDKINELCCLSSIMAQVFKQDKESNKPQRDELWPEEYWTDSESSLSSEVLVSDMFKILDDLKESNELQVQEKLYVLTDDLERHGQPLIALQILTRIICSIRTSVCLANNQKMSTFLTNEVWDLSKIMVGQLIERRPIDYQLSLACILMLPKNDAVALLTSYVEACGKNFSKMKRVAVLAIAASEVYQDSMLIDKCQSVQLAAKWGLRLTKIGIQFNYGQKTLLSASLDALKNLVTSPHCEPEILLEYCSDMKLESFLLDDQLIIMFEICLLKNMQTACIPERLRKAKSILSLIKNNTVKMLKNILPKISSYNYEALEFVLTEILVLESDEEACKGLDLIRYLKYYTRCTAPSEIEIRLCKKEVECEDLAGVLPEISASRLPFHLLRSNNKSKIVTSEMKLQTLTYWLNMSPVIDYKKDTIIGNAVANVMESYLQSTPVNPSSPRVSSEFFAVASQVESILERMEDRQYPVFCCHSLVGRLRHVGEITLTLKVSISYAEKWLNSASEKDEKKARVFIDQLRKELKTSSSKWALQKIGLHHDAELNALIRQPKELIHKLYQHPSVLENCVGQKDINSTCDEIAAIHGLNVLEIRQSLLDKWLLGVSSSADDPDQTMTFGNVCDLPNEKEDLDRALYVLSSRDRTTCFKYLADYFHMMVVHPQAEKRILYCLLKCGADKETDMFDHLLGLDTQKIDS